MGKAADFDTWAAAVARELNARGVDRTEAKHVPYENGEWFRSRFEEGQNAGMASAEWFNYD